MGPGGGPPRAGQRPVAPRGPVRQPTAGGSTRSTLRTPDRPQPPPARPPRRPPSARGTRGRQPGVHWALRGGIGFLIFCILAAGGGYLYLRHQLGQINRVDIPGLADDAPGAPMNVLLVGSDSRARTSGDLADATGKGEAGTGGQRSDTIMVLHVDPQQTKAALLSIPRDLWIEIPGYGNDKVNAAYAYGGAALLVDTLQKGLGIDIHHYVEIDFVGFESIVNTVGGVEVYFAAPARDGMTGLDVPEAGCVKLDGYQALALVRSRFYESYESGRWVSSGGSDFGRIERQQDFIRRMLRKAVSSGLTNPLTLNRLIGIGVDNVTLNKGMTTTDIVRLARRFRNLNPETVDMFTLPVTGFTTSGGASALRLDRSEAQTYIDRINGVSAPAGPRPAETRVRVLNGNGLEGAAGRAALGLRNVGFSIGENDRGDADSFAYSRTIIRHAPAQRAKAQLLASYLVAGAELREDASLAQGTIDVVMVVGADYAGVRPGPASPPAETTSTTAAPSGKVPEPGAGAGRPSC